MFGTLRTLMVGANARAEERVRDTYAIELIEQKIREAQASLHAAKGTLASLIQRQRAETKQVQSVQTRITDLTTRAKMALKDGNDDMAAQAADAIASLENELEGRRQTVARLDQRISQLQHSVEVGHRRIVDLKQGLISAKAVRHEQQIQSRLNTTIRSQSSVEEAEELIAQVLGKEDPFEQSEILTEINRGLSHDTLADRMAENGYGAANKTTGADVLKRLKSK
ncbi:PspA/IM30 family protein [uncultured Litoreibacter sp.]|uniref:PspA/IM30 family protein n=1 Tax=uncultured Litoreibacter sp. TaxID=1392394 RepID=UPI002616A319|nr:PspA/IM30 family protein [uncultured Litoreibacter sp.]